MLLDLGSVHIDTSTSPSTSTVLSACVSKHCTVLWTVLLCYTNITLCAP